MGHKLEPWGRLLTARLRGPLGAQKAKILIQCLSAWIQPVLKSVGHLDFSIIYSSLSGVWCSLTLPGQEQTQEEGRLTRMSHEGSRARPTCAP